MLLDNFVKSADAVGIIGVILLLISYYLLSVNKLSSQTIRYQLLNFFGSGLILFSLFFDWNTAAVIIEISWMIISLIGIYRCLFLSKQ